MNRPRIVALLLATSLLGNVAALCTAGIVVHRRGGLDYIGTKVGVTDEPLPDFPAVARQRFGPLPTEPGGVVIWGDSQVERAPLADLVTGYRQRGIGAQRVSDLTNWVDLAMVAPPTRLVLLVGSNDVDRPAAFVVAYRDLLDQVEARRPGLPISVMSIPPRSGPLAVTVAIMNGDLARLATERRLRFVDLHGLLVDAAGGFDPRWTDDGVHLNPAGYAQATPAFRAAVAP